MKKTFIFIICSLVIVSIIIGIIFISRKDNTSTLKEVNKNSSENVEKNDKEENNKKISKLKGDFWINQVDIPKKTNDFSFNLFDNVAGIPIDLSKLENNCTFNFSVFEGDILSPGEYSVNTLNEIQGNKFYNETKDITVKNKDNENLFIIKLSEAPSDKSKTNYIDSIENNWWTIYINESNLFDKELSRSSQYNDTEILEEVISQLGKPTHIFTSKDSEFDVEDGQIGSLSYTLVYDYDDFKLVNTVNETYNKSYDYRMIQSYGLTYYTNEMYDYYYENYYSTQKDVVNEIVK